MAAPDMHHEATLSEALAHLAREGYEDEFRVEGSDLRALGDARCVHPPEELRVVAIRRFEGVTDPDDESILFALACDLHGVRGTLATAYGLSLPPNEGEVVRRLGSPHSRLT